MCHGKWRRKNSAFCLNLKGLGTSLHHSDFQLSVESYWRLFSFCITTLGDWLKNFTLHSRPIRSKTKVNYDLLAQFVRASCRLQVFASSFD